MSAAREILVARLWFALPAGTAASCTVRLRHDGGTCTWRTLDYLSPTDRDRLQGMRDRHLQKTDRRLACVAIVDEWPTLNDTKEISK